MRIQVTDNEEVFEISTDLWRPLLALARQFGWRPAGTIMPVNEPNMALGEPPVLLAYDHNWTGDYLKPQGQQLKSEDVANLVGYLGMAVKDIEKLITLPPPSPGPAPGCYQLDEYDPRRFFVVPAQTQLIRDFMSFCGEFVPGLTLL